MLSLIRATPPPFLRRCGLAAALLVCLGLTGCSRVEPLEEIRQQQAAGDNEGTLEPLRVLLETDPDDPELNFLYGRALAYTQPNLAGWSLRKAMKDPEWLVRAGTQLAFVALASGDFNEVVKISGRVLEQEPENVRVLMIRANAYAHSKKDPELAIADAKRILEIDPERTEAYEPLILGLLGLGRLDEAKEALAESGRLLTRLEMDDADLMAWHCVTTAAFEQESGDLEQARRTWISCLDAHPTSWDVVSNAVGFYDAQGERDRSLEILREALAGDPHSQVLRSALAQRLHATGNAAEAEALLREAARSEDLLTSTAAWIDLGKLQQSVGEYAAAADSLEQAVERARDAGSLSPQMLFEYADALVLADRYDRALEVAEDLTVEAHRRLIRGRVAQERRDPAGAIEEFDAALQLWPDNPWARYYTALAAEELGDFNRAIDEYRNAIRIDPGATDARTRGARLLLAAGDPSSALVVLQTRMGEAPLEIEGELLAMRIAARLGDNQQVSEHLAVIEATHPAWAGIALAEAADGLNRRAGPTVVVDMLTKAPGVDFGNARYSAALRALVRYSHDAGQSDAAREALRSIFAAHPDSGVFQEIRALDLELAGAPAESVVAAYERALELDPGNAWALAGLGRMALRDDPEAAFGFFDRAASAAPDDPDPKLQAARALEAAGKPELAAKRLDELLLEHPAEFEAALERARLDVERGVATPETLERAERALQFGGGADALELLSRVHALRDEPELAEQAAKRARALRDAAASES